MDKIKWMTNLFQAFLMIAIITSPITCIAENTNVTNHENVSDLIKKADNNDVNAQYRLGVIYTEGIGVPKNADEGIKWFKKAASNFSSLAAFNLGLIYERGLGVPKNIKTAFKWYSDSALLGYGDAQLKISMMYADGEGTKKDLINAYAWLEVALTLDNFSKELKPGALKFKEELKKEMSSEDYKKGEEVAKGYLNLQEGLGAKKSAAHE